MRSGVRSPSAPQRYRRPPKRSGLRAYFCDETGSFDVCRCEGGDGSGGSGASGATGGGGSGGGATGGSGTSRGGGSGDAGEPGTGGSTGGTETGGMSGEGRRLPLPCTAPLPTGYCLVSESGDYIGGGESSEAAGEDSVQIGSFSAGAHLEFRLQNASNGDDYGADFELPLGQELMPGLYEPATRYPFQLESVAGLSIHGNGRGCNQLTGKFAIEEFERDPMVGLVRAYHFRAALRGWNGGAPRRHQLSCVGYTRSHADARQDHHARRKDFPPRLRSRSGSRLWPRCDEPPTREGLARGGYRHVRGCRPGAERGMSGFRTRATVRREQG